MHDVSQVYICFASRTNTLTLRKNVCPSEVDSASPHKPKLMVHVNRETVFLVRKQMAQVH